MYMYPRLFYISLISLGFYYAFSFVFSTYNQNKLQQKMWPKHLGAGDEEPPRTEGVLRLHANKFCPFAKRDLLVLLVKNIPHEIVNINFANKPEWYLKYQPKGLIPTLLDGSKCLSESLEIADYLDEKFPEPPLYPADPEAKKRDQEVIQKALPAMEFFLQVLFAKENDKTPEELAKLFLEKLQVLEDELKQRGTTYFGGETPGMIDFMIFPWAERAEALTLKLGQKVPLKDTDLVLLRKWRKTMMKYPICEKWLVNIPSFYEVVKHKLAGTEPPFDEL